MLGGISFVLFILLLLSLKSSILPFAVQVAFQNDHPQSTSPPLATESPYRLITPEYMLPFTSSRGHLIPPKIWQIMLPRSGSPVNALIDAKSLADTSSWLARNPGYGYILIGQKEADNFINAHFFSDAKVLRTWRALKNPAIKSDLLRYLILFIEGGVYTDVDTQALQPIDVWVPNKYRDQAKVVIGIEWDQLGGTSWADIPRRLQFCQWTIAAAPGHPLFIKMAYHTIDILERLTVKHGTTLNRLNLSSSEVMMSSGPASWTDVVLEQLKEMDPKVIDVTDFSGMKPTGPRLCGDILILTIDAFGMGQAHSNSTYDGTIPEAALLMHKFQGSWRSSG